MQSSRFLESLERYGFNFFAGVPDTILKGLVSCLEERGGHFYIGAVREDDALGMACGAFLAGKKPVVLMQNSGLGTSLNALTSLHLIYRIPCLLIVSWRGHGGVDAPEHLVMGEACTRILDDIRVPCRVFDPERLEDDLQWAVKILENEKIPVALWVKKGLLQ